MKLFEDKIIFEEKESNTFEISLVKTEDVDISSLKFFDDRDQLTSDGSIVVICNIKIFINDDIVSLAKSCGVDIPPVITIDGARSVFNNTSTSYGMASAYTSYHDAVRSVIRIIPDPVILSAINLDSIEIPITKEDYFKLKNSKFELLTKMSI